jgi:hypothetical protein
VVKFHTSVHSPGQPAVSENVRQSPDFGASFQNSKGHFKPQQTGKAGARRRAKATAATPLIDARIMPFNRQAHRHQTTVVIE